MKKKVGILEEVAYSYRFMQKLNQEGKAFAYAYSFSEQKSVEAYLENEKLDVLIVGELYFSEEMRNYRVDTIVVLSEDELYNSSCEQIVGIYKYQCFAKILNSLKDLIYQSYDVVEAVGEGIQYVGVYSPAGRCGKTTLALELAKKEAKTKRVLYVNLERFGSSVFDNVERPQWNLADVFYFSEQQDRQEEMIKNAFADYEGMKLFFPMDSPLDLQGITVEQWMQLFSVLEQKRMTDLVIVDFDECVSCYMQLLKMCQKIYMPVLEEKCAQWKIKKFEVFLEQLMEENIFKKIYRLSIPVLSKKESEQLPLYMQKLVEEQNEV